MDAKEEFDEALKNFGIMLLCIYLEKTEFVQKDKTQP